MKFINTFLIVSITLINAQMITAQQVFTNEDKVANNGYDLVNYFTNNEASRGSNAYTSLYQGATYYFLNEEHREAFEKSPERYLPQFGGYCSFAVAKMNKKVPVDPKTFRIDDGKLYLFYNDYWEGKPFNTIIPWLGNEEELEKMAYTNWEHLKTKS